MPKLNAGLDNHQIKVMLLQTNELASLERSAAANVATRDIQTKPEIPSVSETTPEPTPTKEQDVIEETVEEATIAEIEQTPQQQVEEPKETKKEPLFSVEKEGLLSLDESELDIAKPEVTIETTIEPEEEIVAEVIEEKFVEEITAEPVIENIEATETEEQINVVENNGADATQEEINNERKRNSCRSY